MDRVWRRFGTGQLPHVPKDTTDESTLFDKQRTRTKLID